MIVVIIFLIFALCIVTTFYIILQSKYLNTRIKLSKKTEEINELEDKLNTHRTYKEILNKKIVDQNELIDKLTKELNKYKSQLVVSEKIIGPDNIKTILASIEIPDYIKRLDNSELESEKERLKLQLCDKLVSSAYKDDAIIFREVKGGISLFDTMEARLRYIKEDF